MVEVVTVEAATVVARKLGAGLGRGSPLSGYDSGMIRGYDSVRCKTALITNSE